MAVWVTVVSGPSNAAARLLEAVRHGHLAHEQIAQAFVEFSHNAAVQTAVASFLDRSQRPSLFRLCTAVDAADPAVLDQVVDVLLCSQRTVSASVVSQAQLAMEQQRRLWRQQHEELHAEE